MKNKKINIKYRKIRNNGIDEIRIKLIKLFLGGITLAYIIGIMQNRPEGDRIIGNEINRAEAQISNIIKNPIEIELKKEEEKQEIVEIKKEEPKYISYGNSEIENIIIEAANRYGVNPNFMIEMFWRESKLDPTRESDVDNNICSCDGRVTNGLCGSRGLAQILRPCHPDITEEQALDPYWVADWAARKIANGGVNAWTEGRKMIAEGWSIR